MNRLIILAAAVSLSAQTAVEKLIVKYEDIRGARYFIAQGAKMILARRLPTYDISSSLMMEF